MPDWMTHKLESRLLGEISVTSDMQINTTLVAESEEELKSLLMKVREWKSWLMLNIQKTKIMASGPITWWQIDGDKWKQWQTILGGSKITADGDCSHEIKRHLVLGKKAMTNISQSVSSVVQSCPTLCDPMDCSTPGLPVHHQLPEFTQTRVHWVGDAIQLSHPLSSPSPPTLNLSQHQGLF